MNVVDSQTQHPLPITSVSYTTTLIDSLLLGNCLHFLVTQLTEKIELLDFSLLLAFSNSTKRTINEAKLSFPLPPNSFVSGFASDVNGTLVDAVAVKKEKARETFEAENAQFHKSQVSYVENTIGTPPSIFSFLPHTCLGNVFTTKMNNIAPGARRYFRLQVQQHLGDARRRIIRFPLHLQGVIPYFSLDAILIKRDGDGDASFVEIGVKRARLQSEIEFQMASKNAEYTKFAANFSCKDIVFEEGDWVEFKTQLASPPPLFISHDARDKSFYFATKVKIDQDEIMSVGNDKIMQNLKIGMLWDCSFSAKRYRKESLDVLDKVTYRSFFYFD